MSSNHILNDHAAKLGEAIGLAIEVHQEANRLFVWLRGYTLPDAVSNVASTDVLFIADTQYPFSALDMFWTDLEVVKPDGSAFEGSQSIQEYLGRQWRRFSYHRNGVWNPGGNPLLDHFAFMETRWTGRATR